MFEETSQSIIHDVTGAWVVSQLAKLGCKQRDDRHVFTFSYCLIILMYQSFIEGLFNFHFICWLIGNEQKQPEQFLRFLIWTKVVKQPFMRPGAIMAKNKQLQHQTGTVCCSSVHQFPFGGP